MISTLAIMDILYTRLKSSTLDIACSGGLYKNIRPQGSKLEDIVINCLPITNEQVQKATANVNIYVPDLALKIDAVTQYQPDTTRLKTLADLALTRLVEVSTSTYWWEISNQGILQEKETQSHFINIRIEFKYINL